MSPDSVQRQLKRTWPFGDDGHQCGVPSHSPSPSKTAPRDGTRRESISTKTIEIVCFGSITGVTAQLLKPAQLQLLQHNESQPPMFTIVKEGMYYTLEYRGAKLARLNKRICGILNDVTAHERVSISPMVSPNVLKGANRSSESSTKFTMDVEINIFGDKTSADQIGALLSKSGIYLQHPHPQSTNVKYHNPHFFRVDGYSDDIPASLSRLETPSRNDSQPDPESDNGQPRDDTAVVDSILDSLTHRVDIETVQVNDRIRSPLLPHQKEALDFISQREIGDSATKPSLWQYNNVDGDQPFYQHIFTGSKKPHRNEEKGGIVADEMGLGKSLVMLSTITGTLDRAKLFTDPNSPTYRETGSKLIRTKATLVVAPSSLLIDNWVDEVRKHSYTGAISFHRHLGSSRHKETHLLTESMIVFTTYATIASEFSRENASLARLHWFRIILDEAHDIRNKATMQFRAVSKLQAEHRWCLTGTPIQNSLEDLGALAKFLRVPILDHPPAFQKFITTPISSGGRDKFKNLRLLLQTICIRRTRDLLHLPEPVAHIRRLAFEPHERAQYKELLESCRQDIDAAVSTNRVANSTMLESLLKLRLYCNNGKANDLPPDHDEILSYCQQINQNLCVICSGTIYSLSASTETDGGTILQCSHLICHICVRQDIQEGPKCPACAQGNHMVIPVKHMATAAPRGSMVSRFVSPNTYPTKLRALLDDVARHTSSKSIVFSSWKRTIVLAGELLTHKAIRYSVIDGSLTLNERLKVLKDFRSSSGANVLLMTLGTGAVGLNLAVASRIYLLEPQWNPSIESQAIGRALRLGQKEQVVIIRYIMQDTVEESNVLSRQRKKLDLAGSGFGKSKAASSEQMQAMRSFFGY